MKHPCPCCGYRTLVGKPPGTREICRICCWEDTLPEATWGSNQVSLRQAQLNFLEYGACDADWKDTARPPTDDDVRIPNWETLAQSEARVRQEVIDLIMRAFDGVMREGGVSLHEADVIDNHGTEEERRKARALDRDTQWQGVPESDIEHHDWILSFLDPKGFRYYIAAYMVWTLRHYRTSTSMTSDATIYALELSGKNNLRQWGLERYELLDRAQSRAVYRFLKFAADHDDGNLDASAARRAIRNYWSRFSDAAGEDA